MTSRPSWGRDIITLSGITLGIVLQGGSLNRVSSDSEIQISGPFYFKRMAADIEDYSKPALCASVGVTRESFDK